MGNSLICIASPSTSEECGDVVVANNTSSQNYTKNYYNNTYNFSNPHNNKRISVVDCVQGQVSHMPPPIQVAELMLEFTGCFVVHVDTDTAGQDRPDPGYESSASLARLQPMAACEEARPGHVYMVVPMHRLNQRLSPQDWAAIRHIIGLIRMSGHIDPVPMPVPGTANGSGTCGFVHRGGAKVAPLVTIDNNAFQDSPPSNEINNEDAIREIIGSIFNKAGTAVCPTKDKDVERCNSALRTKPWAPKLDTISE